MCEDFSQDIRSHAPAVRIKNKALIAAPGNKTPLWIPSPKGKRQAGLEVRQGLEGELWSDGNKTFVHQVKGSNEK